MTVQQRYAWFVLAVCLATLVVFAVLLPVLGPGRAWGAFGILGLVGVPGLVPRWRKAMVTLDEREDGIKRRAQLVSYKVFWACFILFCLLLQQVLPGQTVPVYWMMYMVMGGFLLWLASYSTATLVLNGRSPVHEEA